MNLHTVSHPLQALETLESRQLLALLSVPIPEVPQELLDKGINWIVCMSCAYGWTDNPTTDAVLCTVKPDTSIEVSCFWGAAVAMAHTFLGKQYAPRDVQ